MYLPAPGPADWARGTHDNLGRFGKLAGHRPILARVAVPYLSLPFLSSVGCVCCSFLIRFWPTLHSCCTEDVYLGSYDHRTQDLEPLLPAEAARPPESGAEVSLSSL